jgi:hypothetical protein
MVPIADRKRSTASSDSKTSNTQKPLGPVPLRYREAAYAVLDQLDWVINCLHRIRKSEIADVLEKNRRTIIARHGL